MRMTRALLPALLVLAAGSTAWAASALDAAEDACFKAYALHTEGTAECDRLIEEATRSGDAADLALAHLTRALQNTRTTCRRRWQTSSRRASYCLARRSSKCTMQS